ncbi:MAG: hypothetical protein QME75_11605 [Deltaproteobacteria bacterium]|nr:hypothetical protein [Deltaproteobacteria bacterium]
MIHGRKLKLGTICLATALLAVQACSQPPAESPKQEGPPEKVLKVVKAPDSLRTAEIVQRGDKRLVRVDGIPGPEYEDISGLTFMVDGHHLAYEAKREGKRLLVLDGDEWPLKAQVAQDSMKVSPDYRRLALVAVDGGDWQAMVDGRPHAPFQYIWVETLQFSLDSQHLGYLALEGQKLAVVVDGKVKQRLEILKEGKEALRELLTEPQDAAATK